MLSQLIAIHLAQQRYIFGHMYQWYLVFMLKIITQRIPLRVVLLQQVADQWNYPNGTRFFTNVNTAGTALRTLNELQPLMGSHLELLLQQRNR
jgi:hypothetical protein